VRQQPHLLTDMTDAGQLADQMIWASTTPAARDEPFNVAFARAFDLLRDERVIPPAKAGDA
jgi:hypothetical protein